MSSSLPRCFLSGLTFVFLMAAGSCGTRSIIGQQTGQGGGAGGANYGGAPGVGGTAGPGTGGQVIPETGGTSGQGGSGGNVTGTGGSTVLDGGGSCPASAGSSGSSLSFGAAVQYLTHAGSFLVALGDLNGDGKPDLAVLNYLVPPSTGGAGGAGGAGGSGTGGSGTGGSPGTSPGSMSVFLSSTGGYGPPQFYDVGTNPQSIVAGDLNGDGKADLAVAIGDGVSVFFNDGSGALLSPVSFATGTGAVWVALGDLNGDGKADLAVANQGAFNGSEMVGGDVAVLLNMGGGTFVAANYPAGASPLSVAMADLNGDGKADLAVASGTGVSVLLNNGNGTFGAPAGYGSGTSPFSVAAGDLNGDGKIDLAVGGLDHASVLLNLGNGTFAAAVNYSYAWTSFNGSGLVVIGDLNGDGRPDLAGTARADPCSAVVVLPNQGNGVFGAPAYVPASNFIPNSVTLGDLNGDGKLDLVVPNRDGVAVLLNTTP
jgi:FG-GAP-like repeat